MNIGIINIQDFLRMQVNRVPFWESNSVVLQKKVLESLNQFQSVFKIEKLYFIQLENSKYPSMDCFLEKMSFLEKEQINCIDKSQLESFILTAKLENNDAKVYLWQEDFVALRDNQNVYCVAQNLIGEFQSFLMPHHSLKNILDQVDQWMLYTEIYEGLNFDELQHKKENLLNPNLKRIIEESEAYACSEQETSFSNNGLKSYAAAEKVHRDTQTCFLNESKAQEKLKQAENKITYKIFYDGVKAFYGEPKYIGFLVDDEREVNIVTLDKGSLKWMGPIMQNPAIEKLGFDIKEELVLCHKQGIEIANISEDAMILSYVLDASSPDYGMHLLQDKYLGNTLMTRDELQGKGKQFKELQELDQSVLCEYITQYMEGIPLLLNKLKLQLAKEKGLTYIYREIEMPLIEVLADMEFEGFCIDRSIQKSLKEEFDTKIKALETTIYELSEEVFNINSPKQLGEILFVKLGLPVMKKTKTGYSTNAEVLEQLMGVHPIIEHILEYRKLNKIVTTYIDGFENLINEKNEIHTTFNQALTTTGRISSTDPNLQNIPVRTEEGRMIRKMFIASDQNHILVDADYSQIELRVLAHVSQDRHLIEAYQNDMDIHSKTAIEVFGANEGRVDGELRRKAKAVNFGIVYGISDFGLAKDLNISMKEAKLYIDQYLNYFSGVRQYMDDIVIRARMEGGVTTFLGRKRMIPELESSNKMIQSFGERIALNTPIQGSAADIIKLAMIRVYKRLRDEDLKSKLILQVHDELIVNARLDEVEQIKQILKEEMEQAVTLSVPLQVDMNTGVSWYESK